MRKKATLLGLLLLLLIGGGLFFRDQPPGRTARAPSTRTQQHAADGSAAAVGNAESGEEQHPDAKSPLPRRVDLTQIDLDREVHGVVVDGDGKPIAGAKLTLVSYPWRRATTLNIKDRDQEEAGPSTLSASDGTFSMRVRRGRLANLRVRAPGYAGVEIRQVLAGERVRVVLDAGVSVLVRTVDEAGQPVADVTLRVFARPASRGEPRQLDVTTSTDAKGEALFENLPPRLKLWVEADPAELGISGWIYYEAPESGRDELEVKLPKGRTITGRVTDAMTKQPIPGARIGMGWTRFRETTTDADGRYSLPGWTGKGRREIAVDADAYGQTNKIVELRSTVDFELVPGGSVTGRAVDETGQALGGVRVAAIGSTRFGRQQTSRRYTRSGDDGTFQLVGLRTDMVHSLVLQRIGHGRTLIDLQPLDPEQGPRDLGDIRMAPGRAIEGVLVNAAGEPVPRAEIRLIGVPPNRRRGAGIRYGDEERRHTDHLGRFRFPDLSAGQFALNVSRRGEAPVKKEVVLTADEDLLDVEVRLAPGREFLVWVHDEQGNPVPRVVISLRIKAGQIQGVTDEEGKARFTVGGAIDRINQPWVLPSRKQGEVRPAYVRAKPIDDVPETDSEARFVLKLGNRAKILVLGPDGKPLPGALVEVKAKGHPTLLIRVGDDGRTSVAVSPGETVDIVLRGLKTKDGHTAMDTLGYQGELLGVQGGEQVIEMRVTKPANDRTLVVRVEGPDGEPLAGVTVSVFPGPRTANSRGQTDADGRVELGDLLARKIAVTAGFRRAQEQGLVPPAPLELIPNGQEVVLRFEKGVPLKGVLLQPDGKPAAGGQIFVRIGKRILAQIITDAEGRFTVYIPPGPTEEIRIQGSLRQKDGDTFYGRDVLVGADARSVRLRLQKRK